MSDLSPAPTPTNEQQDAATFIRDVLNDDADECERLGADPQIVRGIRHAAEAAHVAMTALTERLAAVSAAAPTSLVHEAEMLTDRTYAAGFGPAHVAAFAEAVLPYLRTSAAAPDERAREEAYFAWVVGRPNSRESRAVFEAGYDAALAARPAPVVSGEVLRGQWRTFRAHHPIGAYLPVGQMDGDCAVCGGEWPCTTVLAALGITVADAPAAEPECICDGDQQHPIVERAGCPWHSPAADDEFPASVFPREEGTATIALEDEAADDEGGQEVGPCQVCGAPESPSGLCGECRGNGYSEDDMMPVGSR